MGGKRRQDKGWSYGLRGSDCTKGVDSGRWVAAREGVGVEGSQDDEAADGGEAEVADGEAPTPPAEVVGEEKAPLLQVRGQPWSPGVYRSLRLLGRPLEIAWKRAFVSLPTL